MSEFDFNYSKLELDELRDIEAHIDKDKYPERFQSLVNEIR